MVLPQSWVQSANKTSTPFPLSNLPYGVFSSAELSPRCGVAIGDQVLDIHSCEAAGVIQLAQQPIFAQPHWNKFMALDSEYWQRFRAIVTDLLQSGSQHQQDLQAWLTPLSQVDLHMPFEIREFTDLCAIEHRYAAGYSGHPSTVVVSGTPIRRPNGFKPNPEAEYAGFGPSARLDVACEIGVVTGGSTAIGQSPTSEQVSATIFGYMLLSNWTAPDTQALDEHQSVQSSWVQPFATIVSPWIVSAAALEPFQVSAPCASDLYSILHDIDIRVKLQPENGISSLLADINHHEICYSPAQQLASHLSAGHALNGCELICLGTVFASERKRRAELLKLDWNVRAPMELRNGSIRHFIEDYDTLSMVGTIRNSEIRIGFGKCYSKVLPAVTLPSLTYRPSATHYHYRYG